MYVCISDVEHIVLIKLPQDQDQYKTSVKPEITKWIEEVEKVHASVGWLIVYCITKESKAKRKQQQLGEKIKNDFCSKPEQ